MINMLSILDKKASGLSLNEEEITYFVHGYAKGEIKDYQMSSLLMAIKLNGMSDLETSLLTKAMVSSGDVVDLSVIPGIKVDKHSTGGVGDKTSLIIGPIVSSLGLKLAKMSGRGLGHTGGTIDKLESIPGFNTGLSTKQFLQQVNTVGMAIVGQTGQLVPADKKMYALRDVTGTVQSIPLIASSIMSKKIASGAHTILLDVKFGHGAFMKTVEEATILAKTMVNIGNQLGKDTQAILTDMNQPLGNTIGNRLEVIEAIETLKGNGPDDLTTLCVEASAIMLVQGKQFKTIHLAKQAIREVIENGKAYHQFEAFVSAQGGDLKAFLGPQTKKPLYQSNILAKQKGFIQSIDALALGKLALLLGAGRLTKEDAIDEKAGIILHKKPGQAIVESDVLLELFSDKPITDTLIKEGLSAFTLSKEKPTLRSIIEKHIAL
jgi:pyrimidine-nucleoside phosphorylase